VRAIQTFVSNSQIAYGKKNQNTDNLRKKITSFNIRAQQCIGVHGALLHLLTGQKRC
jgi:hypothetical protein